MGYIDVCTCNKEKEMELTKKKKRERDGLLTFWAVNGSFISSLLTTYFLLNSILFRGMGYLHKQKCKY